MVTPQTVAAALNPLYQFERVLSGIQLLTSEGQSIRGIARFLNLPEGTVRRTLINQERAPSQATIDAAYNALRDKGTILIDRRGDITTVVPIAPGPAAIDNIRNVLPGHDVRVVLSIPEGDPESERYARGHKSLPRINVPFDRSVAQVLAEAGIDASQVSKIITYAS